MIPHYVPIDAMQYVIIGRKRYNMQIGTNLTIITGIYRYYAYLNNVPTHSQ